jgi:hypothetical protein
MIMMMKIRRRMMRRKRTLDPTYLTTMTLIVEFFTLKKTIIMVASIISKI